jgi:hypothetical protein
MGPRVVVDSVDSVNHPAKAHTAVEDDVDPIEQLPALLRDEERGLSCANGQ